MLLNTSLTQYLKIDTTANPADELIMSSYSTTQNYQTFYIGNPPIAYRVLTINMNTITIFCFFHPDEELTHNEDEELTNNDDHMNTEVVDTLKKRFRSNVTNF